MRNEDKIVNWGKERGIVKYGNVLPQLRKIQEELTEATEAYVYLETKLQYHGEADTDELEKEFGDIYVAWILAVRNAGLEPKECVDAAWNKIKNRTGTVKDGQFVKEV